MRIWLLMISVVACGTPETARKGEILTPLDTDKEVAALDFACNDLVLFDQMTTGAAKVTTWWPCFDVWDEEQATTQRVDVDSAQRVAEVEDAACAGIAVQERTHSPFAHRRSIEIVEPVREDNELVGVRVVFKPVRGLTADWMRSAIACQQARWAAITDADMLPPPDPTLVEGAEVNVIERGGRVEVFVTTPTSELAEIALSRARTSQGVQHAER
jgi:hypothetical protein